jgi:phospholipid-binding lipoprotein MlaA
VKRLWSLWSFVAALLLAALTGCATVPGGDGAAAATGGVPSVVRQVNPKDPWEPWNRSIYAFNEAVDEAVLKPVAQAYVKVMPEFLRTTIGNFFGNFGDAWSTVNHFLQGKLQSGLEMGMRVGVNSVFGVGGLLDIASEAGLERRDEDFGQTLGVWGVPAGPYLVWPILGPSSVRETAAMPLDRGFGPGLLINDGGAVAGLTTLQVVETRAKLLGASRLLGDIALDKYVFTRDAYLTRRRSLVYDGDPPPEPDEDADKPADKAADKPSDKAAAEKK